MLEDLVSVIIPIYNVENYLEKCLESCINQTYKNLDIILVDDGSTDSSLEIAKKYVKKDPRILLITKENGGLSSARNMGLEFVRGTALRELLAPAVNPSSLSDESPVLAPISQPKDSSPCNGNESAPPSPATRKPTALARRLKPYPKSACAHILKSLIPT